ncbi:MULTISPECIES: TatD family hydrolase [unclassified Neisseria]|uniref:TatD family hydrolase n=1 Tax=unclassified Neisseria TaxID=2623750 RepID=UPI0026667765|nr:MULTISPECIES: TatD family hydrolase [unclassified Neisseria]MDO1510273.1 TatD family hydrolase [Neisseria sp. MVDL19-042950]MDO1516442.1 TatD family hydrolase [Neisseria sp. MVDL18-041461]MDO1563590.1 TatD family hydrolase [Neisseria sp. MVDL20-010259]
MKFTDTHCHLADPLFRDNLPDIITEAEASGICRFIVPSTHAADFADVAALNGLPQVHIAFGIHPWFTESAVDADLNRLENFLQQYPQAWVGEIGLDFYDKNQTLAAREYQILWLTQQLKLAQQYCRPVILHNLKATAALVAVVKATCFTQGGIAHAFSGSLEEARSLTACGFKIGIGSLLLNPTAKKARQAARELPLSEIVLETDSPFMLANSVNVPANVRKIAEIVAELRGVPVETVAEATERNVEALLGKCES